MRKDDINGKAQSNKTMHRSTWITVLCDVVLIIALVICILVYDSGNSKKAYDQNVNNITNIAKADTELLQFTLDQSSYAIVHSYNYCNGKTKEEILDYLSTVNNANEEYQLLTLNEGATTSFYHVYDGYSTRKKDGEYISVSYAESNLCESILGQSKKDKGTVCFSQSFTNQTDSLRYFALFCGIDVNVADNLQRYYLVKPQNESLVLSGIHDYSEYDDLYTAVCYPDGQYMERDDGFRGDSFGNYIYKYNDISIAEKQQVTETIKNDEDGFGVFAYKNHKKEDCVFVYATCGNAYGWVVIVSVPISEFSGEASISVLTLVIIVFLAVLLLFNVWRLMMMVRALRSSVTREQTANASKTSFLSRMSHEIRTPLNAIIGYNAIAKTEMSDVKDEADRRNAEMKVMDCLTKSEIASHHLLTVINDVLDMSAIESGKIKIANDKFDFRGLITSLTTVFYSQARAKGIEFEVLFGTLTEEWFVGDQMRVNQVLANLLSNAVKFTQDGGTVKLKIIQPNAESDASHIHFEIVDSGIGMTAEYVSHIWTPYEQADASISRRFGGSGLGLSITKNLVELMGGTISVTSELGVGTTFSVDLTFGKTEQPKQVGAYDFSKINALVVDDDISTCDYIRLLFNRCGAKCAAVNSGEDAIKAISVASEQGVGYSVCLVDWKMPKMDGIETIRRIRQIAGEDIPIIILTAYDYTELADKAMEVGVSRFISKPLFQSSLFDLLANICGTEQSELVEKDLTYDFSDVRLLLTEDNAMNMEIAKTIMEVSGITVDCAWNGREAVEKFEASEADRYTLILMDVHMPEMNGYDATKAIRASTHENAKTIPIIAMTADAFAENIAEAYAHGMNGHISKPIDIPTLLSTVNKYKRKNK